MNTFFIYSYISFFFYFFSDLSFEMPIRCLIDRIWFIYSIIIFLHTKTQFLLRKAYAITFQKSQGQTFDKVVIDIVKSQKSLGLTFEALSRFKHYTD